MKPFRLAFLSLFILLLLAGCQSSAQDDGAFYTSIADLPGVRLSLHDAPPPGFKQVELERVYRVHENGGDIWLSAPDAVISGLDSSGDLRSWLNENSPVSFHIGEDRVYYIPATDRDVLDLILSRKLEPWADHRDLARLWAARGNALLQSGRTDEALDAFEKALALDSFQADANVALGQALLQKGEKDAAIEAFNKALAYDPDNYTALRKLGETYFDLHRYALAVDPLTRAYLLKPDNPKVLLPVAIGLASRGQTTEALQVLDVAEQKAESPTTKSDINTIRNNINAGYY